MRMLGAGDAGGSQSIEIPKLGSGKWEVGKAKNKSLICHYAC